MFYFLESRCVYNKTSDLESVNNCMECSKKEITEISIVIFKLTTAKLLQLSQQSLTNCNIYIKHKCERAVHILV